MSAERIRYTGDYLIKSKDGKAVPSHVKATFSARMETYGTTGAMDGLEDKYEVVMNDMIPKLNSTHTHDATENRCRACSEASVDALGPIDV